MNTQLHHLMYVSRIQPPFGPEQLPDLLAQSREKNSRNQLSGMLLCEPPFFIQILEGPQDALDATYERICQDPRHADIRTLHRSHLDARRFDRWQMFCPQLETAASFVMPDLREKLEELASHEHTDEELQQLGRRLLVYFQLKIPYSG